MNWLENLPDDQFVAWAESVLDVDVGGTHVSKQMYAVVREFIRRARLEHDNSEELAKIRELRDALSDIRARVDNVM